MKAVNTGPEVNEPSRLIQSAERHEAMAREKGVEADRREHLLTQAQALRKLARAQAGTTRPGTQAGASGTASGPRGRQERQTAKAQASARGASKHAGLGPRLGRRLAWLGPIARFIGFNTDQISADLSALATGAPPFLHFARRCLVTLFLGRSLLTFLIYATIALLLLQEHADRAWRPGEGFILLFAGGGAGFLLFRWCYRYGRGRGEAIAREKERSRGADPEGIIGVAGFLTVGAVCVGLGELFAGTGGGYSITLVAGSALAWTAYIGLVHGMRRPPGDTAAPGRGRSTR